MLEWSSLTLWNHSTFVNEGFKLLSIKITYTPFLLWLLLLEFWHFTNTFWNNIKITIFSILFYWNTKSGCHQKETRNIFQIARWIIVYEVMGDDYKPFWMVNVEKLLINQISKISFNSYRDILIIILSKVSKLLLLC